MRSSLTVLPDSYAFRVNASLERLNAQQLIKRLWERDASLWSAQPAEQRTIRQRLGWLSIASVMQANIEEIQAFAKDVLQDGFSHALLLGMGGSSLFSEVCGAILGARPGWLGLSVLDSTDPLAIAETQRRLPLEQTLFIVSSKSGTTTEVNALCDYFYAELLRLKADEAGRQFVAITDSGTPLEAKANRLMFRKAFIHGQTTGQDVGGRFSALTFFGLVPAALMGIDISRLLANAKAMMAACGPEVAFLENPAAQLAGSLSEGLAQGRDKVSLVFASRLAHVGSWIEQLIAESTGKNGRGLIPICGEPIRDPDDYPSDRLFVELQLAGELDARLAGAIERLAQAGHPVIRLRWQDPHDLGGEAVRWFVATALAGNLMQINPFDEPNVQESKDRTNALLDEYAREHKFLKDDPLLREGDISVYGKRDFVRGRSVTEAFQAFVVQTKAPEYLAVLSFLPRTSELDATVQSLRDLLAGRLGVATMLGYGPRYLHSTGQLYKGGPGQGTFLLITAEDSVDLPVPGRPYSFSVLKQAQALGDFQALRDRNRRVLLFHLGKSPLEALGLLSAAL